MTISGSICMQAFSASVASDGGQPAKDITSQTTVAAQTAFCMRVLVVRSTFYARDKLKWWVPHFVPILSWKAC